MNVSMIPGTGFSSNIYLVESKGEYILVDAGLWETRDYVQDCLEQGLRGNPLELIFLTHRHCDHIGGAGPIAKSTGTRILAPAGEIDAIRSNDHTTGAALFGVHVDPLEAQPVEPGEKICIGGLEFEIIHTPGHTSGGTVLYEKREKALFTGDTVFAGGGVGRWDLPTGDFNSLVKSITFLSDMDVESMYPGHGPPVEECARESIMSSLSSLGHYR